ncbi:MAG: molybdate ABC transporter substrate-binding protein [Acidobacteria bacterium]|nr:molybdate ABC transporter substrate-binding protein [Acidobacteriota bacterium]
MFGLILQLLLLPPAQAGHPPIIVSAAISLTDALEEIRKAYVAAGGPPVRFNFAASNVLARQIANGAPVDIFISADEAQMDFAQRAEAIDATTRVVLVRNRLAVVTPMARPLRTRDVRALTDTSVRRIAIGDPSAVPAGVYARQYLEQVGIWKSLQQKLLPLANVRAALAAVALGSADAAIVYASDAKAATGVQLSFVVEGASAPRILYPAALTRQTKNRTSAAAFLKVLQAPDARTILERHGFLPPDPRTYGPTDPRTYGPPNPRR